MSTARVLINVWAPGVQGRNQTKAQASRAQPRTCDLIHGCAKEAPNPPDLINPISPSDSLLSHYVLLQSPGGLLHGVRHGGHAGHLYATAGFAA